MKFLYSILLSLLITYNANANDFMQIAKKADNLKKAASRCYLSIPKVYQGSLARMYLQGNDMHKNGVIAIKSKRLSLARTYLINASNIYTSFMQTGKNVGGRSC